MEELSVNENLVVSELSLRLKKEPEDNVDEVIMGVSWQGSVNHYEPAVRPQLKGLQRIEIAHKAKNEGINNTYYNLIDMANIEELQNNEFTNVFSASVIKKAVSQLNQSEKLDKDCIRELELMKECYRKDDVNPDDRYAGYIQNIGASPFRIILFSPSQIELLRKNPHRDLYFDATGSIIKKINQKAPYLYTMAIKPNPNLPPITVADMISTDQSQPSIMHFLLLWKHALNEKKSFRPRKIEVDWSWALINSCLLVFNGMNLKRYLNISFDVVQNKHNKVELKDFSVIHICVSYMIKTFANKAKKISLKNKHLYQFLMKIFVLLSNKTDFKSLRTDLEYIMTVLLSPNTAEFTEIAEQYIADFQYDHQSNQVDMDLKDEEDSNTNNDTKIDDYMDIDLQTIGEASPWRKLAQCVKEETNELIKENNAVSNEKVGKNLLYSPDAADMLIKNFMYIYPLWSGVLLGPLNRYATDSTSQEKELDFTETRDSNAIIESWFSIVKKNIFRGKERLEPSFFITTLKQNINARLKEISFPNIRKTKIKINKGSEMAEEKWSRKRKLRRNLYQPQKKKLKMEENDKTYSKKKVEKIESGKPIIVKEKDKNITVDEQYPDVPRWGGKTSNGQSLLNTCTVDNFLSIVYVTYYYNPNWINDIKTEKSDVIEALMQCLKLMSEKNE